MLKNYTREKMKIDTSIQFLYIDLFCGAGGTSTGVEEAKSLPSDFDKNIQQIENRRRKEGIKCAKVIGCINHDKNAIASHSANHPETLHFIEDIRTLVLDRLLQHIENMKKLYPNAKIVLWASLECTNFSKAKGGLSRNPDSRTLAEHLYRYIEAINPDYVQIENVEEFLTYGPVEEKVQETKEGWQYCPCERVKVEGKTGVYHLEPVYAPVKELMGTYYNEWVEKIESYSYNYDYRVLNSADYGAFTSRKRYFGIFAKEGLPIAFPEPTHSKDGSKGLFDSLLKWKPVKECLNFSDEGESIFDRKKPLVEATHQRILSGLVKFVAGGKDKWILKYNSVNGNTGKHNPPSIDEPSPTISCQGRLGLVQATPVSEYLIQYNKGSDRVKSVDDPCNTITTYNRFGLVQTDFLSKHFSGDPYSKNISVEEPAGSITTVDHHSKVNVQFLQSYYGNGGVHSLESPSPTVTTKDRLSFISPKYFMDMQYGNGTPTNIDEPAATVTTNPKHQLVQCDRWLMNTNFNNVGSSIEEPSLVITANRKWHYLMNPQYSSAGGSVDKPCFTLIARMDKQPPYLIEADCDTKDIPSFIKFVGDKIIYEIYDHLKMICSELVYIRLAIMFSKTTVYDSSGSQKIVKRLIGRTSGIFLTEGFVLFRIEVLTSFKQLFDNIFVLLGYLFDRTIIFSIHRFSCTWICKKLFHCANN